MAVHAQVNLGELGVGQDEVLELGGGGKVDRGKLDAAQGKCGHYVALLKIESHVARAGAVDGDVVCGAGHGVCGLLAVAAVDIHGLGLGGRCAGDAESHAECAAGVEIGAKADALGGLAVVGGAFYLKFYGAHGPLREYRVAELGIYRVGIGAVEGEAAVGVGVECLVELGGLAGLLGEAVELGGGDGLGAQELVAQVEGGAHFLLMVDSHVAGLVHIGLEVGPGQGGKRHVVAVDVQLLQAGTLAQVDGAEVAMADGQV